MEFKVINEFPDYEISRITSDVRRRGRTAIKKHQMSSSGNKRMELSDDGKRNLSVAYLMYETFIGSVPEGKEAVVKVGIDRLQFGENDLEALTTEEKQERLRSKRKSLIDSNWEPHPQFSDYLCNENGEVFSLKLDRTLAGNLRPDDYLDLTIENHKIAYHRFVWEAYHGRRIEKGYDIDHINNDTHDNRPSNLQKLTRAEHNAKTTQFSETRRRNAALRASKAIVRFRVFDEEELGDEEPFESLSIAQEKTGFHRNAISKHIGQVWQGYLWQYKRVEAIEGEVWKDFIEGIRVSDKGRIDRGGIISRGIPRRNEYFTHSKVLRPKRYPIKRMVCQVFNGDAPAGKNKVRHIDGNTLNNAADNLVWTDSQEIADNLSSVNQVVMFDKSTKKIIRNESGGTGFVSASAAARFIGVKDSSNLSKICRGKSNSRQKWNGRIIDLAYSNDLDVSDVDGFLQVVADRRLLKVDRRFTSSK